MSRQTQNDRVLRYFLEHPGSTTLEAIQDLGIRNITARMSDLRERHVEFAKWQDDRGHWRFRVVVPEPFDGTPRADGVTFACMTPDEYALWSRQVARARTVVPCYDCPSWFARAAQAEGCCEGRPGLGRPSPLSQERRAQMREASRRYRASQRTKAWKARLAADVEAVRLARARARGYNADVEYSDPIAHNAQRPPVRLYSELEGVDVREYRPNAS